MNTNNNSVMQNGPAVPPPSNLKSVEELAQETQLNDTNDIPELESFDNDYMIDNSSGSDFFQN